MTSIVKRIVFLFFILFVCNGFTQETSTDSGKSSNTDQGKNTNTAYNFGKVEEREITIKDKYAIIDVTSITLSRLKRKYSKDYYNSLDTTYFENTEKYEILGGKKVIYQKTIGNKVHVLVPPLKPNRFYQIKMKHSTRYNLYSLFKAIDEEGFDKEDKYSENQDWMEILQILNLGTDCKMLYIPSISEIKSYKAKLKDFNLSDTLANVLDNLTKTQKTLIREITFESFEILNFRKNTSIEKIIEFAKWANDLTQVTSFECGDFLIYFKIPDYLRIYEFYLRYLKEEILDYNDIKKVKRKLFAGIEIEKNFYETYAEANPVPNFIFSDQCDIGLFEFYGDQQIVYLPLNTFEFDFKANFKRSLVPDFGYVWNLPTVENGLSGGQLFVGVNISLSPVNKDVPLALSDLTLGQRLSIHTAITLNSLAKENFRDDFFGSNSLLLGVGYKALTQSTRLNGGVLLFQKLDPINGSKSLGVHPYIGLSIDIEIKKWLESTIPSFTNKIN